MKALKSNFYLIKVDNKPIYVGYTNRPIKTRFREHLHDKDFGDGKVSVESLGSLSFDFTWDINTINQYAKEVSDRETELIAEYGTATSVWQKGINGNIGGQVWADIKHFVTANRNNPKFVGLSDEYILNIVDYEHRMRAWLGHVIGHTQLAEHYRLESIIRNTKTSEHHRLENIIRGTKLSEYTRLRNVIGSTELSEHHRLENIVRGTKLSEHVKLKNIIGHTQLAEHQRLGDLIGNTKLSEHRYLVSVINSAKLSEHRRLGDIIRHTKITEYTRLSNIITNTRLKTS